MKTYLSLLSIAMLLVWFNWQLAGRPIDISIVERKSEIADSVIRTGEPQASTAPIMEFTQTYARPLFSPTRRPYVEAVEEPPEEPAIEIVPVVVQPQSVEIIEPLDVSILGIQTSPKSRKVLLRGNLTGEVEWISIDQTFGGWTVNTISQNSVRFENGEQTTDVLLYEDDTNGVVQ